MLVEVIGVNVQDVIDAEKYGANRIELCSGMLEGGLTPSYALIKQAITATSLPINVMVRPHANSFVYSKADVDIMCEDIKMIKKLGANGIVIGPITEDNKVDEEILQLLLHEAKGMEVTFHRGFDELEDQETALQTILRYPQITTILTAGGPEVASESIDQLIHLQTMVSGTHLTIMPGSGLKVDNMQQFYDRVIPKAIHFGTDVRLEKSYANRLSEIQIKKLKTIAK